MEDRSPEIIRELLDLARRQLQMDVAFIGEFTEDEEVLRWVTGNDDWQGQAVPLDQTYCHRMVTGRLSRVVPDTSLDDEASDLEATRTGIVGAYVGAPIVFSDGRVFGTLCCVSHRPDPLLRDRDAQFLAFLATLIGQRLEEYERSWSLRREAEERIRACLAAGGPKMVFQPIIELGTGTAIGYEGLARFYHDPLRPPNEWFAEAWHVGLGIPLELAAVRQCPPTVAEVSTTAYVSLNVSPDTVQSYDLDEALGDFPRDRLVLELTEHAAIDDYDELHDALRPLRSSGVRLAIDDAGAGYASFRHILQLRPDIIKLDRSLTSDIDGDDARWALASALIAFAGRIGATIVAEGVERPEEGAVLTRLGVRYAQGYLFGFPMRLP